jgi:hypothetical protein
VGEHAWCVCILNSQTEICVPTKVRHNEKKQKKVRHRSTVWGGFFSRQKWLRSEKLKNLFKILFWAKKYHMVVCHMMIITILYQYY